MDDAVGLQDVAVKAQGVGGGAGRPNQRGVLDSQQLCDTYRGEFIRLMTQEAFWQSQSDWHNHVLYFP